MPVSFMKYLNFFKLNAFFMYVVYSFAHLMLLKLKCVMAAYLRMCGNSVASKLFSIANNTCNTDGLVQVNIVLTDL